MHTESTLLRIQKQSDIQNAANGNGSHLEFWEELLKRGNGRGLNSLEISNEETKRSNR